MAKKIVKRKKWTAEDNAILAAEYPKGDLQALALRFGVSYTALTGHAFEHGIKRDPELLLQQNKKLGAKLAAENKGARFVKGQVSHNKGKKQREFMSPESIERTKATRFKKNRPPQEAHNYRPIGYERETPDGYIEIKVRDRTGPGEKNFELKQRLVYTQLKGSIPEGHVVEFIDGNKRNFAIDNLRCVTRRENIIRNGESFHSLPPDLKENVKLLNKLKKELR